jgi:carboxyl-terminal processing protease
MDFSDFKEDFAITQKMMDKIIEIGEREGVEFDEEGYQRSEGLIKTLVKAQIARSVWENDGFYPIINEYNEILQKALTLFDRAETLAENY